MQLLIQVDLADYVKVYFGLGLGLVTSDLGTIASASGFWHWPRTFHFL